MRKRMVLAVGLALLMAAPVMAQGQRRGQGRGGLMGGGGVGFLLMNEGVQKELKMDADQVEKANKAVTTVNEKFADDRAKLRDLDQSERFEKMRELNTKVSEETMTALNDVLKPEQVKRLKQIELQNSGAMAFSRPDVVKALNLNDDQKEKIKTINQDSMAAMREMFQGGAGGDPQEAQKKMAALRKETNEKITAVLTDDQKKTWKDMTGEPFTVQFQGRRGRQDR